MQKVAEIQIRQGVERTFRLKSTLSHFGRGSEAPFEQVARRPSVYTNAVVTPLRKAASY